MIFFEDTILPDATKICADYALVVSGSCWCEDVLRANRVTNVATVIQGVDISVFHPGPRADTLEGRFAVFSGGKLEHRKAQDLVIQAFAPLPVAIPKRFLLPPGGRHGQPLRRRSIATLQSRLSGSIIPARLTLSAGRTAMESGKTSLLMSGVFRTI